MKNIIFLSVLSLFIFTSCGGDDSDLDPELLTEGGPFEFSELAGNWEATQAVFYRISDNWWVDIVAEGGSLSLSVLSSGRCTFTIAPIDCEAYMVSGEMFWSSYEGDEALAIVWDGSSSDDRSSFRDFQLTSTTFNLGCSSECGEYDYDNDGNFDVSDLGFIFTRQ